MSGIVADRTTRGLEHERHYRKCGLARRMENKPRGRQARSVLDFVAQFARVATPALYADGVRDSFRSSAGTDDGPADSPRSDRPPYAESAGRRVFPATAPSGP